MPVAALHSAHIVDSIPGATPLAFATDCDFRPSGSASSDRAILDEAGIERIVVDFAQMPKLAENGWRGTIRSIVDQSMITGANLRQLHDQGVRAVRVRLDKETDALPALADSIVSLGWHIEVEATLRADAALLAPIQWTLMQMPVALCFADRSGYDPRLALDHPDVALIRELVQMGRGWVKLTDAVPSRNVKAFVEALLACRSDRVVWGSGTRRNPQRPLAASLEDLVGDATERRLILSQNPARLYGFGED